MLIQIEKVDEINGCDGCIFDSLYSLKSCKKLRDTIYNCHGKFIFRMVDIIDDGRGNLTWELTLRE